MANEKNLKPIRSENEAREKGRKGGIASGEARRQKKTLREALQILMDSDLTGEDGEVMSGAEAMAARVFQAALKDDWKAWELVRDTAGQKPIDKIVTAEVDSSVIAEIEGIVNGEDS